MRSKEKISKAILVAFRIILALVFIFSGFVKAVDPWGTAIKIGDYLTSFGMSWLIGLQFGLSILLSGAELLLGLLLLFGIRVRTTSLLVTIFMIFFTCLTLGIAIWDPVEDCGCFGDAVKLTNWQTFFKNLVLLPMSAAVFYGARRQSFKPTRKDLLWTAVFAVLAFGIGIYSYYSLPIIDFLPYKKGTDLRAASNVDNNRQDIRTTVIYRNIQTGRQQEFELTDTTWYDDTVWEYVDTKIESGASSIRASARDFSVFDNSGFITDEILDDPGTVYMICVSDPADISSKCAKKLESGVREAHMRGYRVLCLTSVPLSEQPFLELGADRVKCYNMDATTLKTMLRAKVGVVVITDGMIADKKNCRNLSLK